MESNKATKTTLQQVVCCPVCQTALDDCITFTGCKHISCCKCATTVKERNNGHTWCPVCDVQVSGDEVIFTNPLMKAVLSLTNSGPRSEEEVVKHCGKSCLQCGSEISGFKCIQCDNYLCEGCRPRHLLIPSCKDHTVEQLFENQTDSLQKIKVDIPCPKHLSKIVEMNCITCNTAICSQCKFEEHDTHNSESVASALERCLPKVESVCSEINNKVTDKILRISILEKQSKALLENRIQTKSQVEAHKEKMVKAVLAPINNAYEKLCKQIDTAIESQLNHVTTLKDQLKYEVRDEQSVKNWAEVTSAFTSGGGLLSEFQSGLLHRLDDIVRHQAQEIPTVKALHLVQFVPCKADVPEINLGDVTEVKQDISPNIHRAPTHVDIHFRKPSKNLCKLSTDIGRVEKTVKVNTASTRMCFFDEKLWIPSATTNTINVFPIESDGESVETILDLGNVFKPQSLHPLNDHLMALASDSGVYSIDADGHVVSLIKAGKFCDVFVDEKTLWALEVEEKKMYSWSILDLSRVLDTFPIVTDDKATGSIDTICVHRSSVYVCSYDDHIIRKYDLQGNLKKSFGKSGCKEAGELTQPTLCATDGQGDILVADCGNHRLQLLSTTGQWSVIPMKVFKPRDIVLVRSTMYILHSEGNKISIYPL